MAQGMGQASPPNRPLDWVSEPPLVLRCLGRSMKKLETWTGMWEQAIVGVPAMKGVAPELLQPQPQQQQPSELNHRADTLPLSPPLPLSEKQESIR